jgi:Family of unknown function (DUF6049)
MIRRSAIISAIATLLFLSLFSYIVGSPARAQEEGAKVSASMKSFFYQPGERAYLDVDLQVPETMRTDAVDLDLLVYSSASTRSNLAAFKEGMRRYPIIRRTLDSIPPEGDLTGKEYEVDLNAPGFRPGVYPFEVRILQDGKPVASDYNFLVIMDPGAGYPLNLSLLWPLDFTPAFDAQGNNLDNGLVTACSSSGSEKGFLYTLTKTIKQTPEVPSSMVLPYSTYQDLASLVKSAEKEINASPDNGVVEVKQLLDEMFKSGQVDLMATTYANADLDNLSALGWDSNADSQMKLGSAGAQDMGTMGKGFISPLFHLSDSLLQRLVQDGREFTVVGEEALQESAAGKRLLEGTTLSQPVNFVNKNGYLLKAFVRDEILYRYLEGATQLDASHVVQDIFAELAVLQREKPYAVRSCILAFPSSFVPSQDFLQELYNSIKGCSWLKTRPLTDLNRDQFPVEGVALQAPDYSYNPTSYSQKLDEVGGDAYAYSGALPENHPLRDTLSNSILIAQNYHFMDEKDVAAGQNYLDSIEALVGGEMSKVKIEQKRSVTLSGMQGNLAVDITSGLDYPIMATLRMENTSLSFPEGNSKDNMIIEPRENRFVFSVNTHRKGSFMVDIVLEANGLVIDRTSIVVNTSIINTLAIILLAALAFIVAMVVLLRRLSRKLYSGKHSRGRKDQ